MCDGFYLRNIGVISGKRLGANHEALKPSQQLIRELSTSCRENTGAACKVSSGKGGIVSREKSTVTRCLLADWQLSSSSSALRTTQAECLRSSLSLYTRRHVGVKGKFNTSCRTQAEMVVAHTSVPKDNRVGASHGICD